MQATPLHVKLRARREEHGLSRQQLAEGLGVKLSRIKVWELGYRSPPNTWQKRIAEFYRISMSELHREVL